MTEFSEAVRNRDFGLADILAEEMMLDYILATVLTLSLHVGFFRYWKKDMSAHSDGLI